MTNFDYSKIPIGYYDQVLTEGLKNKRGLQSCWHHIKFKYVKNAMEEYESHLDIACGPGTFIGTYLDSRSVGIDISSEQIQYAKKTYSKYEKNFICHDITKGVLQDKQYDVITLLEFIEHIPPEEVNILLKTLYEMLDQKGKIIITTPNYKGLWPFLEKLVSLIGPVDYKFQHINKYTVKRIKEEINFKNVSVKKYINFGIFTSFFNHNVALKFENYLSKIFNCFFGYSLLIIIKKN